VKSEAPLFIVDPHDNSRKMVGSKQVQDDGSLVWFRRLGNEHVMRAGSFGVDATTYDVQFQGHPGKLKVVVAGTTIFEVDFPTFETNRTERDLGHGRQYFLEFRFWAQSTVEAKVSPLRAAPKLVFGQTVRCPRCKGKGKSCAHCGGRGYVDASAE
jgi:hypothetical protein